MRDTPPATIFITCYSDEGVEKILDYAKSMSLPVTDFKKLENYQLGMTGPFSDSGIKFLESRMKEYIKEFSYEREAPKSKLAVFQPDHAEI